MLKQPDWKLIRIPFLEMDLAHACDLKCRGCTHYSNYGLKGSVPFQEGEVWLRAWATRLTPGTFSFLGGEPLLNPDLLDYLRLAGLLWPDSKRILITNGLNCHLRPGLFETLAETGTRLDISVHSHKDQAYLDRFNQALVEIERARLHSSFEVMLRTQEFRFYRTYRGEGPDMRPFEDKNPEASWQACQNSSCCTIHQGALWKCPPLAYLGLAAKKFDLDRQAAWRPYLAYRPVPVTASEDELVNFFMTAAEPACAMCPAKLDYFEQGRITKEEQPALAGV